MTTTDRRTLLTLGAAALAFPASALARPRRPRDLLIVNALGGFENPNRANVDESEEMPRRIEPRLLADAHASGMDAVNITLGYVAGPTDPFDFTLRQIGIWDARLRNHQTDLLPVLSADDILRARRERRIGVIYGFQNSAMFGDDPSRAQLFADLGIRVVQLTYNPAGRAGHGSMAPENRGLTRFGRDLVAALNEAQLMVDLSHSGERTCLDAARLSIRPFSIIQ
jgi:membrane dipeptidase